MTLGRILVSIAVPVLVLSAYIELTHRITRL